jgi:2-hydroxy-6-oxonona-2,4-dienedioate hydrolase
MAVTPVRSCWVLANGVRTHYVQCGDSGPAVVLCHGAGPGGSGNAGFRKMIPALGEHFQVYAPDQLSFGLTDVSPHAWPVKAYQSLVDHVADFIDALCLDEVMLAGNSQGAYVAVKYALDHPERVKKLFLIGSGTISNAMGTPMPPSVGMGALAGFDGTEQGMRRFLETVVVDKSSITDALVLERLANVNRPGVAEARKAFSTARARMEKDPNLFQRFDLRGRLPQMTIPTRFIWGKLDTYAPVELGKNLEKQLPNIPFTYIDGAGHQCQTDQPEVVNSMVNAFFRGV